MARKKSAVLDDKPLTEREQTMVDAQVLGDSLRGSMIKAGYSPTTNSTTPARTDRVKNAIAEARTEIRAASTLSRLDVIEGIMDAVEMARLMSEPATMIAGYDKLAKIIGAYAPETIKVEVSMSQGRLRSKMEAMSDEELLAIQEGSARVVEGEFVEVRT